MSASTSSSSSSILLTPVRKESTINLTPPPPPSPTTRMVQFPSLPNLVDLHDEDYSDSNGRPIGFFLIAPAAAPAATPTRRDSRISKEGDGFTAIVAQEDVVSTSIEEDEDILS